MGASVGEGTPPPGAGSRLVAAAALALVVAGCSIDMPPADFAMCMAPADAGTPPEAGMSTTPDYWHDAKPILDAKCAACHTSGGIAPFMILTLADVEARAAMIRGSIASGHMP